MASVNPSSGPRPRVAVVSHGFYPTVGGSERYHLFTARSLTHAMDVEVFTSNRNLPGAPSGPQEARVSGLRVHYLPSTPVAGDRFIRPGALWASLRRFRPAIVWGNHPSPTADVAGAFAVVTGLPWIATYHADVGTDRWWKRLYHLFEKRWLRRASRVLVTSEAYRRLLVERGVSPERLVVTVPGPYIGDGTPPRVAAVVVRPPAHFLFVGALDEGHAYKRLDVLLDALAEVRTQGLPATLDVVGDGPRREFWVGEARRRGLSKAVNFLGRTSDEQLAAAFARATALVLPAISAAEGFGSVAVEATLYGCPVLTSSAVPIGPALAAEGAALVFDAGRPATLGALLLRIGHDPGLVQHLSERAASVSHRFTWSEPFARVARAGRELVAEAAGTGDARSKMPPRPGAR